MAGIGATSTAALYAGGNDNNNVDFTEDWNGSTWQEVADLNTTRGSHAGTGTNTAALNISGYESTVSTAVEEWSGSTITTKVLTD